MNAVTHTHRSSQRGAWMRMRFAISGTPAKAEGTEAAPSVKTPTTDTAKEADIASETVKAQETKEPAAETKQPAEMTNDSTKFEASTGS